MGWSEPYDGTAGEVITETIWDTYLKNNLRYLKGEDGVPTIQSGLIIASLLGTEYLLIPSLTTTERTALTPVAGMLIYNETTTQFNKYENGAWRADLGFNSDHGGLSGLADEDHSAYIANSLLTEQGSIIYRNATIPAQLLHGTTGQALLSGGHGANPTWGVPTSADLQTFTSSGTWTKPAGVSLVYVEVCGASGGGGGGQTGGAPSIPAGGGGGGARAIKHLKAADLGATEAVTIGAAGTGGAADNDGVTGGISSFGTYAVAQGGLKGLKGAAGVYGAGGQGGSVGSTQTALTTSLASGSLGVIAGGSAEFGGGGGGTGVAAGAVGGKSVWGGGAGAGGGNGATGKAGGGVGAWGGGEGGTAGTNIAPGGAGADGTASFLGAGGGSGGDTQAGGAGGTPSGGGGGGGSNAGVGGTGRRGEVRVWSW